MGCAGSPTPCSARASAPRLVALLARGAAPRRRRPARWQRRRPRRRGRLRVRRATCRPSYVDFIDHMLAATPFERARGVPPRVRPRSTSSHVARGVRPRADAAGRQRHRGPAHLDRPQPQDARASAGPTWSSSTARGHMVILERTDEVNECPGASCSTRSPAGPRPRGHRMSRRRPTCDVARPRPEVGRLAPSSRRPSVRGPRSTRPSTGARRERGRRVASAASREHGGLLVTDRRRARWAGVAAHRRLRAGSLAAPPGLGAARSRSSAGVARRWSRCRRATRAAPRLRRVCRLSARCELPETVAVLVDARRLRRDVARGRPPADAAPRSFPRTRSTCPPPDDARPRRAARRRPAAPATS